MESSPEFSNRATFKTRRQKKIKKGLGLIDKFNHVLVDSGPVGVFRECSGNALLFVLQ